MSIGAVSWILWGIAILINLMLALVSGMLFGPMPFFQRIVHLIILFLASVGLGDLMAVVYAVIVVAKGAKKINAAKADRKA